MGNFGLEKKLNNETESCMKPHEMMRFQVFPFNETVNHFAIVELTSSCSSISQFRESISELHFNKLELNSRLDQHLNSIDQLIICYALDINT